MKKYGFMLDLGSNGCGFCDDYDSREEAEKDAKYYAEKENVPSYKIFEYEA